MSQLWTLVVHSFISERKELLRNYFKRVRGQNGSTKHNSNTAAETILSPLSPPHPPPQKKTKTKTKQKTKEKKKKKTWNEIKFKKNQRVKIHCFSFLKNALAMIIYRCKMFHFHRTQGYTCIYKIPQCYYRKHCHHSYGRWLYTRWYLKGENEGAWTQFDMLWFITNYWGFIKTRCSYKPQIFIQHHQSIFMTFIRLKVRLGSLPWQNGSLKRSLKISIY